MVPFEVHKQISTIANSFYSLCHLPHPYSPHHITLQHQTRRYGEYITNQLCGSPHIIQLHYPHKAIPPEEDCSPQEANAQHLFALTLGHALAEK